MGFPQAQTQTLFLGLSQTQANLEFFTFPNKLSLNMHYLIKLGSFTAIEEAKVVSFSKLSCSRLSSWGISKSCQHYIGGNLGYVEETSHWSRNLTLKKIKK